MALQYNLVIPLARELRGVQLVDPQTAPAMSETEIAPKPHAAPSMDDGQTQAEHLQQERIAIQRALAGMLQAVQNLEAKRQEFCENLHKAAVELAATLAARVVWHKIESGDFAIEALVREAVSRLHATQPVRVLLHPDDITLLQSRLDPQQQLFSGTPEVQLVGDPAAGRGNCQAESGDVTVMSNWYAQLENMRQQLLENMPHGPAGH